MIESEGGRGTRRGQVYRGLGPLPPRTLCKGELWFRARGEAGGVSQHVGFHPETLAP